MTERCPHRRLVPHTLTLEGEERVTCADCGATVEDQPSRRGRRGRPRVEITAEDVEDRSFLDIRRDLPA